MPNDIYQIYDLFATETNSVLKEFGQYPHRLSEDIIQRSIFLNTALVAISNSGLFEALSLKGGSALQRAFISPRISADLDFSCIYPRALSHSAIFFEVCNECIQCLKDAIAKRYAIRNITIEKEPSEKTKQRFYNGKREVATWSILLEIPEDFYRIIQTERNAYRSPRRNILPPPERRRIKIDIANIKPYEHHDRILIAIGSQAGESKFDIPGNTEDPIEMFAEKAAAILTREVFKPQDVFDMLWAECAIDNFDITTYDGKYFLTKIKEQGKTPGIALKNLEERLSFIRKYDSFFESIRYMLPEKEFRKCRYSQKQFFAAAKDRLTRFANLGNRAWLDYDSAPILLPDYFKYTDNISFSEEQYIDYSTSP